MIALSASHSKEEKLQDLQILRGLAILSVIFYHLSLSSTVIGYISPRITSPFYWTVELFFVLSGYVVTISSRKNNWNALDFAIKRIFRLYPAILVMLAISLLVNRFYYHHSPNDFIKNLFSVPTPAFREQSLAILGGYLINLFPMNTSYCFGAMWSLSVEFQFYFFFLLILATGNLCRLKPNLISAIILSVAMAIAVFGATSRIGILFKLHMPFMHYLTAYRFDFMAYGVILSFINKDAVRAFFSVLPKWTSVLAFAFPFFFLAFARSPLALPTGTGDSLEGWGMLGTGGCSLFLVASGSIQSLYLKNGILRSALGRIGDCSYNAYLIHFSLLAAAWFIINEYFAWSFSNPLAYGLVQLAIVTLILVVISKLIYITIEQPGISLGRTVAKLLSGARRPIDAIGVKPVLENTCL